jgi:hypothetical protein
MAVVKKQAQEAKSQNIQPTSKPKEVPKQRFVQINGVWTPRA